LVDGYQNHHRSPESPQGESLAGFFVSVTFRDDPPESSDNWYTYWYTVRCILKTYTNFRRKASHGKDNAPFNQH
jgi:hypothetical protein